MLTLFENSLFAAPLAFINRFRGGGSVSPRQESPTMGLATAHSKDDDEPVMGLSTAPRQQALAMGGGPVTDIRKQAPAMGMGLATAHSKDDDEPVMGLSTAPRKQAPAMGLATAPKGIAALAGGKSDYSSGTKAVEDMLNRSSPKGIADLAGGQSDWKSLQNGVPNSVRNMISPAGDEPKGIAALAGGKSDYSSGTKAVEDMLNRSSGGGNVPNPAQAAARDSRELASHEREMNAAPGGGNVPNPAQAAARDSRELASHEREMNAASGGGNVPEPEHQSGDDSGGSFFNMDDIAKEHPDMTPEQREQMQNVLQGFEDYMNNLQKNRQ